MQALRGGLSMKDARLPLAILPYQRDFFGKPAQFLGQLVPFRDINARDDQTGG
jgi:hypothetical protein